MTGKDLIELLLALPIEEHELPVIMQGCDCDASCSKVVVEEPWHEVYDDPGTPPVAIYLRR